MFLGSLSQSSFEVPFFFFLSSSRIWTQGITLSRQTFTTWATPPALFHAGYFQDKALSNYLPGLASNCDLPSLCLLSS
jgi:hypothetical protein